MLPYLLQNEKYFINHVRWSYGNLMRQVGFPVDTLSSSNTKSTQMHRSVPVRMICFLGLICIICFIICCTKTSLNPLKLSNDDVRYSMKFTYLISLCTYT